VRISVEVLMTDRVLVADDSLTIQKVVGITLAGAGYELVQAHNEADLFKHLSENDFKLVLLDINLSEDKSGYDLSKLIRGQSANTAILGMLGTFDSIDENQMELSGIDDKIVKPFDSDKFIQKCRVLIEEGSDINVGETQFEPSVEDEQETDTENDSEHELGSDWVVDSPKPEDNSTSNLNTINSETTISKGYDDSESALAEEMLGWGIEVPSVIGSEALTTSGDFPSVIEESNISEPKAPTSHFVSVEELTAEDEESFNEELDDTNPSFEMPADFKADLANEIESESEAGDFWAVDEDASTNGISFETEEKVETEIEEPINIIPEEPMNFDEPENVQEEVASIANIDEDALVAKLTENLKPMLESLIKEYCQNSIEQVAWEVIPDLAENLIKKEIKELSDSVR
jgi:CheY-like chemotaxis protein